MAHLFHVGAGSGGMVVLDLLARDPRIDRVTLVEPDVYKPHNVHRHLFPATGVGRLKAELAAEWLRDRRPDLCVDILPVDVTDPAVQPRIEQAVAACDLGVCAADTEPAKYHVDQLMRAAGKPWTLGEVLSGGIGGWVHRFVPDGPCYGCVASHLQRSGPTDQPPAPAPDYANPNGAVAEATIPASRASISAIASLHAVVTLDLLANAAVNWTSLLMPLAVVPDVFDAPFRPARVAVPKNLACLVCSAVPVRLTGEELDVALDQALGRLGHE
jgi:molybdopterin/thiamine biosynthesis adenylyltransferase